MIVYNLLRHLMVHFEIIGYSRAAAQLAMQGMYDEAKEMMLQVAELKAKKAQ